MRKHFRNVLQSMALPAVVAVALAVLMMPQSANATTVVLDPTGLGVVGTPDGTTSGDWAYRGTTCSDCIPVGISVFLANKVTPGVGTPSDTDVSQITGETLTQLYKHDPADSGAFAASYTTVYFNDDPADPDPGGDPSGALITLNNGGLAINTVSKWLEVKDGQHDPNVYLFDISGWDGIMNISLVDFWLGGGAISHVAIYGGATVVPLPAALPLFGTGLGILGFLGWRRRRKAAAAL